jgi:glycosyltransferase involved in cell wall biosynthesis
MPTPRPILFIAPVVPASSGNGLAIRAGLFRSAFARVRPVQLVVVPVWGEAGTGSETAWELELERPEEATARITAQLGTPAGRRRAQEVYPLPTVCRQLSPRAWAELEPLLQNAGLVHVMRSYLMPSLERFLEFDRRAALTLDIDELDSWAWAQLGDHEQASAFTRLEREVLHAADHIYVATEADAERLRAVAGAAAQVSVVPNAVRAPDPAPTVASPEPTYDLLFVGTLSYPPNVDAACWLCESIRPRLPGVRIAVVGRNPTERVRALDRLDGVSVAGDVADVAPWYQHSRIAVAPLRFGGGMRVKIAEALTVGRPVVATTQGATGFQIGEDHGIVIADSAETFATACRELLDDPLRAGRVARAGHAGVTTAAEVEARIESLTRVALARQQTNQSRRS